MTNYIFLALMLTKNAFDFGSAALVAETVPPVQETVSIAADAVKQDGLLPMAKDKPIVKPKVQLSATTTEGKKVVVTAYTSEPGQTDDTPCIAADGTDICQRYAQGEKICATNDQPIGASLYVPGYGTCTVADRMNTRYTGTGRVDIYLGLDTPAAFEWGAHYIPVSRL